MVITDQTVVLKDNVVKEKLALWHLVGGEWLQGKGVTKLEDTRIDVNCQGEKSLIICRHAHKADPYDAWERFSFL